MPFGITDPKEKRVPFTSDRTLYLTADKSEVVEEGDERAAFLLVREGSQIDDTEAKQYGLKSRTKAEDKSATADEDKSEDLESLTKAELVERAEEAGVDSSGTKAELVERLTAGG